MTYWPIALQALLTVLLLVPAWVVGVRFFSQIRAQLGYDVGKSVIEISIPNSLDLRTPLAALEFEREITGDVAGLTEDRSAALGTGVPFQNGAIGTVTLADAPNVKTLAFITGVSDDYFSKLRISLVKGRLWTSQVDSTQAVVSRRFAMLLGGQDVVGTRIAFGGRTGVTIVGMVSDVRMSDLGGPPDAAVYVPFGTWPEKRIFVIADVNARVLPTVRRLLWTRRPGVIAARIVPLTAFVSDSVQRERLSTLLLTAFSTLALLLTATGIYAVTLHDFVSRRGELGIRLALGATGLGVAWSVVSRTLFGCLVGLLTGSVLAIWMVKGLGTTIPISNNDIWFGIATTFATIGAIALLAALQPSLQAAAIDPTVWLAPTTGRTIVTKRL